MGASPSHIIASLTVGFAIGLIVTHLLEPVIFFSLFVGIPMGIVAGFSVFVLLHMGKKRFES